MKELESYVQKIERIIQENKEYKFEAYSFVLAGLHYSVAKLDKARHISGQELLEGIREYALEQFGPMAKSVLNYWGIYKTLDFGKIVFALVEAGVLRKQPEDKLEDFQDIYDFDDAFQKGCKFKDE